MIARVLPAAVLVFAGCSGRLVVENKLGVTVPPESMCALRSALPTDEGRVRRIEFDIAFHPADQAVAIIHYAPMRDERSVTYTRRFFRNQKWPSRFKTGQGVAEYKRSLAEPGTEWSPTSATPYRHKMHVFSLGRENIEVYLDRNTDYEAARKLLDMLPGIRIPKAYAFSADRLIGPATKITRISASKSGLSTIWWGKRGIAVGISSGVLVMRGICHGCS